MCLDDILILKLIDNLENKLEPPVNSRNNSANIQKIQEESPPRQAIQDPVTCSVCYETVERANILSYNDVPHDICEPCFVEYLKTQISNNKVSFLNPQQQNSS